VGGHLSTFLYATPLLKHHKTSTLESRCLRNTGLWDRVESFVAGYQCIADQRVLKQLTQTKVVYGGEFPWPIGNYTKYQLADLIQPQPFSSLLPRQDFNKWFYALFWRLALPFNGKVREIQSIVYSPLNLTIFFRMISHLSSLGYPSHVSIIMRPFWPFLQPTL